ncbi:MAG: DUF2384 domain-containing protein [Pseudomonadales bacterium]|nr:DUF2384 domain-containing protein [Gammaproteobacteria bacterium]NNL57233.1 DUF2384 domain-containing protein [Pseudomonadales bacterium]
MKNYASLHNHAPEAAHTPSDAALVASAVVKAAAALGLKRAELAATIGVSEPTLSRLKKGQYGVPEGKPMELALLLIRIYRALYAMVGGDSASMQHWVKTPNRHLAERAPLQLMQTVEGIAQVLQYLDAMRG